MLAKLHTVAVRGRVVSEAGAPAGGQGAQQTNFSVILFTRSAMGAGGNTSRGTAVTPEGTFDFRGVTPGSYFLIAQVNAQGKSFAARMAIQVGGANVEGITLPIRGGVPVSGRVRVEGETTQSIGSVQVLLRPAETGGLVFGPLPTQQVKADGSFQMDDVGADRYTISFTGVPEGFYVKSVRSANADVQADGLEVAGLSPAPLDVVLSPNAGQVTGTVLDPRTQKAALAMMVVLVPQEKERRGREAFYRTATSDLSGQFTFKSVVPGEYRVYVWEEEVEYGAWMDPDFMKPLESRGEAVSVSEGGRQAVQVNLISADAQ
jgi:hypothetical protein